MTDYFTKLIGPNGRLVANFVAKVIDGFVNAFKKPRKKRNPIHKQTTYNPLPQIIKIAHWGQKQGNTYENGIINQARQDDGLVSDFGKEVCATATTMITHMVLNDLKKYHNYLRCGFHGTLPIHNQIVIHISQGGYSGTKYGSGSPGDQWGQGWVGGPDTQKTPPKIYGSGWGGFIAVTGTSPIITGPILIPSL